MLVSGMQGLGDNIYQRAIIGAIKERVYLRTSWPQLYKDFSHVLPVRPNTRLRTQGKNIERQNKSLWYACPSLPVRKLTYTISDLKNRSILEGMRRRLGVTEVTNFDLPHFEGPIVPSPYVVVRPVTVRAEWTNYARSPDYKYIDQAAKEAKKKGFYVISVADLKPGLEWSESLPYHDRAYHKGELDVECLMGLIIGASAVIGGVGWIVPAAIAAGVPLVCVLGGLGAYNAPEKLVSPPMNTSKTTWLRPDNFCMCNDMLHACDKHISNFQGKIDKCLSDL